jgi:hypothetical protein
MAFEYHEVRPLTICAKADISIQGSNTHYCSPRTYLENIQEYSTVEIALFDKSGKWIQPRECALLQDFKGLSELIESYEKGYTAVGYNIPINLVNDLVTYLNQ